MREFVRSLRGRLVLITAAAVASLLVGVYFQVVSHQQTRERQVERRLSTVVTLVSQQYKMEFESVEALLTAISLDPVLRDGISPHCTERFKQLDDQLEAFGYSIFGYADADGTITCLGSELDRPVNHASRPYYENVMDRQRFSLGAYRLGELARETIVVAAYPILDQSGTVRNLIGAGISVDWLNQFLQAFSSEDDAVVQLIDEEGTVVAQHPYVDGSVGQSIGDALPFDRVRQVGTGTLAFTTVGQPPQIVAFAPVDEDLGDIFVAAYLPKPGYFDWWGTEASRPYLLAIAIAIAVIAAVGLSIHITVRAGFRRVSEVSRRLADGNFSARTGMARYAGEFGGLASDLDRMAEALEHRDRQIISKTNRLEETNKDLEHFAYIASHDLREPLRGIDNLVQWIIEDSADNLSEESRYNMERLRTRVERLHVLLDGLLQYSRASRLEGDNSSVNTRQLILETVDLLDLPAGFSVDIDGDMPVLRTNAPALRTVFSNLIGNSVQHHDRDQGRVVVSASTLDDTVEFTVTDDGPGVPARSHGRIFDMFQTLNASGAQASGGIGLAIVKRLVETHGGTIRIASPRDAERGSSFHFGWKAGG